MRDFPIVRSWRAAAVSVAGFAVLTALCFSPAAVWAVTLLYLLGACALCLTLVCAGAAPCLISLALAQAVLFITLGAQGALCGLIYFLPTLVLFVCLVRFQVSFWRAAGAMVLMQAASQLVIFLLLQNANGGQLYQAAGTAAVNFVSQSELGDSILLTLYQYGLIGLSSEQAADALIPVIGGYALSEAAKADFLLSLNTLTQELLKSLVPSMLVTQSLFTGLLSLAFPLYRGRVYQARLDFKNADHAKGFCQNPPVPQLNMPAFAGWYLPRGWGLKVAALGLGYFLAMLGNDTVSMLGQMLYGAFSAVYTVQGMAVINFMQTRRGTKPFWRYAAPILMLLFLPFALIVLGLADQLMNLRGLRTPPENADGNGGEDE